MEIALCARCYRVRRRGATRQPDEGCPEMSGCPMSVTTGARGTAIAYTASLLYVYV